MADSAAFDLVCSSLQRLTSLTKLEARGTVRLALKEGGFDARDVTPAQMVLVLKKVLPDELGARGVPEPAAVCDELAGAVSALREGTHVEAPDEIFERMGGD